MHTYFLRPSLAAFTRALTIFLLFVASTNLANADICKVVMNGTTFTPPSKPTMTTGTNGTITVFGNWVDIAESITANKGGVTITKSNPVSGGLTPCNTNIRLSISLASTVSVGELTITLRGAGGSLTGSFKIDVIAPPLPLCGTPEGQLSMMLAPVITGTPTVTNTAATYNFRFTSDLFKVAQPEATNTTCASSATYYLYHATTSAALSNLDNLAANDNTDLLATPAGVTRIAVTFTRSSNVLTCSASQSRSNLPAGNNFYRVAKRITKDGGEDPYVFSATSSFMVNNAPPVANAGSDKSISLPTTTVTLSGSGTDDTRIASYAWSRIAGAAATISSPGSASTSITGLALGTYTFRLRVTDSDGATAENDVNVTVLPAPAAFPDLISTGISQPLYGGTNGNVGDGTYTYYMLSQNFCSSLPQLTAYTQDGSLPAASFASVADKRIMKLSYPLPPLQIQIKNQGTATTGAGFRVDVLKGTTNTLLQSLTIPAAVVAGATAVVTYNTRGTATVYRFPGFDGETDLRFCYVREELNHTFPASLENNGITVKVDAGTTINEDAKENNNSTHYPAGTSVIIVR